MITLGINAAFHDSAACLVRDGRVIAAAEEERFSRIKHAKRPTPFSAYEIPHNAIHYCLKEAGLHLNDVDHIAYSFNPYLLLDETRHDASITLPLEPSAHPKPQEWISVWDPLFLSSIVNAPRHLIGGFPHHLRDRFEGCRLHEPWRWHFVPHHFAHAASAFLPSPFQEAAILTLDGRGERATTAYFAGTGSELQTIGEVCFPHSLGLLYEKITGHLGFLHSSDEYKVMALASYGQPRYLDEFRDIVRLGSDGSYTIADFDPVARFGPKRDPGTELEQRHFDIARSLQTVLEETVLSLCDWLKQATGFDNLCLAGGVALNCVMNSRIRDDGPFRNVWVQPAAGDAGTALGAALWIDSRERKEAAKPEPMEHCYLGPEYSDSEIEDSLRRFKLPYRRSKRPSEEAAELLAQGRVLGWFQGRMEFGPRALGARSILATPTDESVRGVLNCIKDREDFRPVAPCVIEEKAAEWFFHTGPSPFMLFVSKVRPEKAAQIPAARHVDGTARVQTVNRRRNPLFYDLLRAFERRTGVPVLINTSFNIRGEPIVCSPRDAIAAFATSPLDGLVIGSFLLEKRS